MIRYKRGEIVLLPFPFTDLTTLKQRPAVVISSDQFNLARHDVIVAAITSQIPEKITDFDYLLNEPDLKAGGLPKASLVKLAKIVTLDQRIIHKKLGCLPVETTKILTDRLHKII